MKEIKLFRVVFIRKSEFDKGVVSFLFEKFKLYLRGCIPMHSSNTNKPI